MKKYKLHKLTIKSLIETPGRFFSILLLMLLGSMTLIALKVTGPDIDAEATKYFNNLNVADLTIISSKGIREEEQKEIEALSPNGDVEYSCFKDVTIKGSNKAFRLISRPEKISKFKLVSGRLPSKIDEIAISNMYKAKYDVGDTIEFHEKGGVIDSLRLHKFKIVGFVNSGEILSKQALGSANAGAGVLDGYAVTSKSAFISFAYTMAKIKYRDLKGLDRDSSEYLEKLDKYEAKYEGNNKFTAYTQRTLPGGDGVKMLHNISFGINKVGDIFPVVLYLVAALVTVTTMTRFVNEERINAGVLKALGYTDQDVINKFILYGGISGILGTVVGAALGTFGLPYILCHTLLNKIDIPMPELKIYWKPIIFALICSLLCSVLPAVIIAKRELKDTAAQLLLPKVPARGAKIWLEKIKPLWRKLSFTQKVTTRNIFRYKLRMLMTVFGVAGSVALLYAGLGIAGSVNGIHASQFDEIINYDAIVAVSDDASLIHNLELEKKLESDGVKNCKAVYSEVFNKKVDNVADKQAITLLASKDKTMEPFVKLKDAYTGDKITLSADGAVITSKMASLMKLRKGGCFTLHKGGKAYRLRVAGICEMYAGHYIYMSEDYYEQAFGEKCDTNAFLVEAKERTKAGIRELSAELMKEEAVASVVQNTSVVAMIDSFANALTNVMIVLTIMSLLLAVVILYNLTNINVAERIRELCTIKVLGFLDKEVAMYIYRDTIILSVVGMILGLVSGMALHRMILRTVAPAQIFFDTTAGLDVYLKPVLAVAAIIFAMWFVVYKILRKVDMLEALKSVD